MGNAHQEQRVVAGETSEVTYDGAFFLVSYVEAATVGIEAQNLRERADNITRNLIEKLLDEDSHALYQKPGEVPAELAETIAGPSLAALILRARGQELSHQAHTLRGQLFKIYKAHYAGKRLKITSLSEGNRAIRKLGLGHAKEHIDEVQGKLIIQDYDLLTKPMPLLNIRGKIDWFDVKVLDHKTLAPLISIEMLE